MSLYRYVCVFVITWLPINKNERWFGTRGGTFQKILLLCLTPDSYLHTPAKLLIGQLLSFRLGPAQRENRDGLQPSVGDFGNDCTLSHSAEVAAKLF